MRALRFARLCIRGSLAALALAAGCVVLLAAAPAGAQTTQPAQSSSDNSTKSAWSATLSAFAHALLESPLSSAIEPFLCEDAAIRRFNDTRRQTIAAVRDRACGATIITMRTYAGVPATLASDLGADLRESGLPDDVKRRFIPGDERDTRRANEIAAKWVQTALNITGTEPVGVIVLWPREEADPPESDSTVADRRRPLFILVKAELADGHYRIRQISYGDPVAASGG